MVLINHLSTTELASNCSHNFKMFSCVFRITSLGYEPGFLRNSKRILTFVFSCDNHEVLLYLQAHVLQGFRGLSDKNLTTRRIFSTL